MRGTDDLEPLFPDRTSDEPVGRQLTRRLRRAIETGVYAPSSRLLPHRELATRLGLSRNTVAAAIEQLVGEGYLESRVGSGTFVAATIVGSAATAAPVTYALPESARRFDLALEVLVSGVMGFGPLRAGVPDVTDFPYAAWSRIARRKLAELPDHLGYPDSRGEFGLRQAIAQHVQQFRGVSASADRVIVVEGTQAAVCLAADVLSREGDAVLVEDPGYPFVRMALYAKGLRLVPLRVDDRGMDVLDAPEARFAFVAPSHQFPLGVRMSFERRRALLDWATAHDAYIIEDDYDSEFAYDGKPLPTIQSIDRAERVVYVGTFSKTLAPALRLGYLIVPPHLAHVFGVARIVSSLGGPRFVQATLAEFMSEGHFARYVSRMSKRYDSNRRALRSLLERELPAVGFSIEGAHAGLHLTIVAPDDFDDIALARDLAESGVHVQTLSSFCVTQPARSGFVVGYGAAPIDEVLAAVRQLAEAIRRRS